MGSSVDGFANNRVSDSPIQKPVITRIGVNRNILIKFLLDLGLSMKKFIVSTTRLGMDKPSF